MSLIAHSSRSAMKLQTEMHCITTGSNPLQIEKTEADLSNSKLVQFFMCQQFGTKETEDANYNQS